MNRKLLVLNAVLAVVGAYGGTQLWREHKAAKARAAALAQVRVGQVPVPPYVPLSNDPPVLPAGYSEVAMKNLFHPSRNAELPPPPAPPPPPPPPPMPDVPKYYGQMNIGDGPMALLAERSGMPQKAIKPGEGIGQFKLVDVNTSDITFTWNYNGTVVRRTLSAMLDQSPPPAVAGSSGSDGRSVQPAAPPPPPEPKSAKGPGGEVSGFGTRPCDPNDSMPAGSVVDGYKKTVGRTPFGSFCVWDRVK